MSKWVVYSVRVFVLAPVVVYGQGSVVVWSFSVTVVTGTTSVLVDNQVVSYSPTLEVVHAAMKS